MAASREGPRPTPEPSAPGSGAPVRSGKLTAVAVLKNAGFNQEASMLGISYDLSRFSFYQKGAVREGLMFGCRTVAQHTPTGQRQVLSHLGLHCYAYNRDGLVGVAVIDGSDASYPARAAFAVVNRTLDAFSEQSQDRWRAATADSQEAQAATDQAIKRFARAEDADKLLKVQRDLDETKLVLIDSIEKMLDRGEKLSTLVDRSRDLSYASRQFAKDAKAMNRCCRLM